MPRMFKPATARQDEAFTSANCLRCLRSLGAICPILKAGRRHDTTDPEFPSAWIYDDDGRPTCTALTLREGTPAPEPTPVAPVAVAPAPAETTDAEGPEVASISITTIGKGLAAALKPRPGRRAWTVPYAAVRELFSDDGATKAMRAGLEVPEPTQARVHRNRQGVTITASSRRDRSSVTTRVSLKFAGKRA